uniref:Ricin B-type lectin domain-containing protein n=1 Tax=Rhabditophanes sp. KR3021 TaxID=114890 RepID=A0AC35TRB8_9BILA
MKYKLENTVCYEILKKGCASEKTDQGEHLPFKQCDAMKPEVDAEYLDDSDCHVYLGRDKNKEPGYVGVSTPDKNIEDEGPVQRFKQHSQSVSLLIADEGSMTRKEKFFAVPLKRMIL